MPENSISIQLNTRVGASARSISSITAALKKVRSESERSIAKLRGLSQAFNVAGTNASKLSNELDALSSKLSGISSGAWRAADGMREFSKASNSATKAIVASQGSNIPTESVGIDTTSAENITATGDAIADAAEAMEEYYTASSEVVYSSEEVAQVMDEIDKSLPKPSKLDQVKTGLKSIASELKGGIAPAHSLASALDKVRNAIGRIAFYRMIRSAIKAVTSAFKEGITNLYYYSEALNNTDASKANYTMNEFASTALYVKNSLGAALMPILQSLLPIVNAIADAFITAANAINQFWHAIHGEGFFTKAKRYATEFGDALGGAAGKAKELKKQIFGFDELNIFNEPSSGGGGGNVDGLDYSKMFEEAELSEFFKNLRDRIEKNLGKDFDIRFKINVKDIIFNWRDLNQEQIASKILAGFYGLLGGIAGFAIGGAFGAIVGSILGVTFAAFISTINFNGDGKLSAEEVGAMIRDVALTLTGGVLGFAVGGLKGALIGMSVAMSLDALIKTFAVNPATAIEGATLIAMLLSTIKTIVSAGGIAFVTGAGLTALGINATVALALNIVSLQKLKHDLEDKTQFLGIAIANILNLVTGATIGFAFGGVAGALIGITVAATLNILINDIFADYTPEAKRQMDKMGKVDLSAMENYLGSPNSGNNGVTNQSILKAEKHGRAKGGYVPTGTYFYAGESGAELVGVVGGRTQVTNTEQFAAGMADVMDNTNTVILQAAQALISAIQNKDMTAIVSIGDRDVVGAYDRGKRLAGASLVE